VSLLFLFENALLQAASPSDIGIQILPTKADGFDPIIPQQIQDYLAKELTIWDIQARAIPGPIQVMTVLKKVNEDQLRLVAEIYSKQKGKPILRRAFLAPKSHLNALLHRVMNVISKSISGHETPASKPLLLVQDFPSGVSEIVMASPEGGEIKPITQHGTKTLAPTAVRSNRFAYITYLAGPPQIWGMDLINHKARRIFASDTWTPSRPALSPDGKTIAFGACDHHGLEAIGLVDWETGKTRLLTPFGICHRMPSWSPDGTRIAFVTGETKADTLVVKTLDGVEEYRLSLSAEELLDPAWSTDGQNLAYVFRAPSGESCLRLLNLTSQTDRAFLCSMDRIESPRWSPQGPWIAISKNGCNPQLVNTETGKCHPLTEGSAICHTPRWVW